MSYLNIKKRCIRCRQYLREDGTCQNKKCVRYSEPNPKTDVENVEQKKD